MSFPAYESYGDSGVEWLEEVPSHWNVLPLGRLGRFSASGIDKVSIEGQPTTRMVNYTDVFGNLAAEITDGTRLMVTTASPERIAEHTLADGDFLFTPSSETAEDIAHAVVFRGSAGPAVFSYHLQRFQPAKDLDADFGRYALNAVPLRRQFTLRARGTTRQILGRQDFNSARIALPPREEQQGIAKFLDRETAKIDALVKEQRRLIDLLKEKRQAVISHAVTKGLNPAAPMKHSGVEWLGEVPAHWEVGLLKRSFQQVDYGISESLDSEGAVGVLRMGDIGGGEVLQRELKYVPSVEPSLLLRAQDLLFNRTNSLDQIGKVGLLAHEPEQPLSFASYLVRIRLREPHVPKYFSYLLNTQGMLGQARARAFVAIGQCNLNPTRYGEITVALPPKEEQSQIVAYLADELDRLGGLTTAAESSVALLHERRSALISAAVTGKIDVRGAGLTQAEAA